MVSLERNLYRHLLAGLAVGKTIPRNFIGILMGQMPNWQHVFRLLTRKQGADQGLHIKKMLKNVNNDKPTLFHAHVHFGCTQRERRPNEIILEKCKKQVGITNFCWSTEKIPQWKQPHAQYVASSHDVAKHG